MANSRMKDYFDLWVLLRNAELDQAILEQAVQATMTRGGTVPSIACRQAPTNSGRLQGNQNRCADLAPL